MPLYISDYLVNTTHLNTEQHGAYLLLIMTAWKSDGKLPCDPQELQQITRMTPQQWAKSESTLRKFFFVTNDCWINNRVREELDRSKTMVERKSAAGKKANTVRWGLRSVQ